MSSHTTPGDRAPVVWLANDGGHDYEEAKSFGTIIPLTAGSVNIFRLDRLMVNLTIRLQQAKPQDYLLISGLPLLNALIVAIMLEKFGKIRILQWANKARKYVELNLDSERIKEHSLTPLGPV